MREIAADTGWHRTSITVAESGSSSAILLPREGRSELRFSLGFAKPSRLPLRSDGRSDAMAGAGGSIGMANPALGLGFAYTPNRMGFSSHTDPREVELRDAVYQCLDGPPQTP